MIVAIKGIAMVFQEFPLPYQHYIFELVSDLYAKKELNFKVNSFKKSQLNWVDSFPNYYKRIIFNKIQSIFSVHKKLTYPERYWLKNFAIIHLQHSFLHPHVLRLLELEYRPKIVITLRGADTYLKPWIQDRWSHFYQEHGNKIDAFITMSKHQKEYLQKWGVNESKIHVIPVSFGNRSLEEPKYPNSKVLKLVSAFRMTWEKNIEGNIRLAKILKERGIPLVYDIYGDGEDLAQLYYLVDRYDLKDCVHIKGRVENTILKEKLKEYDFFLQLSLSEALSASIIEAQSKGLPAIISDSDGLPEAVLPGVSAIVRPYFELELIAQETIDLWKNEDLYYLYSSSAIKNANEKFTIENEVKALTNLYHFLLKTDNPN